MAWQISVNGVHRRCQVAVLELGSFELLLVVIQYDSAAKQSIKRKPRQLIQLLFTTANDITMGKARTALDEMGTDGTFKRKDSAWRNWISSGTLASARL